MPLQYQGRMTSPDTNSPLRPVPRRGLPVLAELRTYADARWRDRIFLDLSDHLHATEGPGLPGAILDTFLRQDGHAVVIFDELEPSWHDVKGCTFGHFSLVRLCHGRCGERATGTPQ